MADVREPGASGTLEARFISLEKSKSKAGKTWAKVKLIIGESEVDARAYGDNVIGKLEGFAKRELFTFWGTLDSSKGTEGGVFTNLKIAKVYDDGDREGGQQCYILGTIKEIGEIIGKKDGKVIAKYMDLDVTSNPQYPSFVRLQFAFGTGPGDLAVGETIEIDAYLNKFGMWVVDGPERRQTKEVPAGTRSFRRDTPKPERTKAPEKESAAEHNTTPAPASDEDVPW